MFSYASFLNLQTLPDDSFVVHHRHSTLQVVMHQQGVVLTFNDTTCPHALTKTRLQELASYFDLKRSSVEASAPRGRDGHGNTVEIELRDASHTRDIVSYVFAHYFEIFKAPELTRRRRLKSLKAFGVAGGANQVAL